MIGIGFNNRSVCLCENQSRHSTVKGNQATLGVFFPLRRSVDVHGGGGGSGGGGGGGGGQGRQGERGGGGRVKGEGDRMYRRGRQGGRMHGRGRQGEMEGDRVYGRGKTVYMYRRGRQGGRMYGRGRQSVREGAGCTGGGRVYGRGCMMRYVRGEGSVWVEVGVGGSRCGGQDMLRTDVGSDVDTECSNGLLKGVFEQLRHQQVIVLHTYWKLLHVCTWTCVHMSIAVWMGCGMCI